MPTFDLFHLNEWMAGLVRWNRYDVPKVLSLATIERTRRNDAEPDSLSKEIEEAERDVAQTANLILTPHWLRDQAIADFEVEGSRVEAFPMEGRFLNEWDCPLDLGHVKMDIQVGPLDRLILFVGPLEHAAGVDILLEALPVVLSRIPNLRLAYAGAGAMHGHLHHRAQQLGVAHAVRLLGDVERSFLTRLLRASEVLILPSRYRYPFDDATIDLARLAGRPVVTTHSGPAHLIRHEENGLITYDNPGSMVWAMDRALGEPHHAERMGRAGKRSSDYLPNWSEVAHRFLELCASRFPELTT